MLRSAVIPYARPTRKTVSANAALARSFGACMLSPFPLGGLRQTIRRGPLTAPEHGDGRQGDLACVNRVPRDQAVEFVLDARGGGVRLPSDHDGVGAHARQVDLLPP